jgi:hypothetical protein
VLADQLGHLEHGNGFLAAENRLKFVIGVDVGFLFLVLEPILFYVPPKFLRDLSARHRFIADHSAESGVRLYRFINALGLRFFFAAAMWPPF